MADYGQHGTTDVTLVSTWSTSPLSFHTILEAYFKQVWVVGLQIAQSFVNQYYWVLNENVEFLHQFYRVDSTVAVSETLGSDTPRYVAEAAIPMLVICTTNWW